MKALNRENTLKDILSYITGKLKCILIFIDYMRAVIENGNNFTKEHVCMMLRELNHEHIDTQLAKYLSILLEELEMTIVEFDDFIYDLNDN